jgi:hypothetical protein
VPHDARIVKTFRRAFRIRDSRRVATYVDGRGRHASLYVARSGAQLCHILVQWNGVGGGCSPARRFLGPNRFIAGSAGRLMAGVVANNVTRVLIIGTKGGRHPVKVSPDGGFIYNCRAYNGCAGLIACIEAYGVKNELLGRDEWVPAGCHWRGTR